jgi:hypothetical protein
VVNSTRGSKKAASFGQPISEYDPASRGQQDFKSLAQEVIGVAEHPQTKSKRLVDSLADQLESIGASANELLKNGKPAVMAEPPHRQAPTPITAIPDPGKGAPILVPVVAAAAEAPAAPAPAAVTPPRTAATPAPAAPIPVPVVSIPAPAAAAAKPAQTVDERLSDYYGVNQVQDAVVFVTLYPRAKNVQLAGDFNWQPDKTTRNRRRQRRLAGRMKLPNAPTAIACRRWPVAAGSYNERTGSIPIINPCRREVVPSRGIQQLQFQRNYRVGQPAHPVSLPAAAACPRARRSLLSGCAGRAKGTRTSSA